MDSAEHECAFFAGKLGMLFNMHNDRLTIVGLDSHLYGQASSNVVVSPPKSEPQSTDSDEATKSKYQSVISLIPSDSDGPVAGEVASSVDVDTAQSDQHQDQNDNKKLAAAKILSAFADFDENSSPRSENASPVDDTTHQLAEHSSFEAVKSEIKTMPLPGEDINFADPGGGDEVYKQLLYQLSS